MRKSFSEHAEGEKIFLRKFFGKVWKIIINVNFSSQFSQFAGKLTKDTEGISFSEAFLTRLPNNLKQSETCSPKTQTRKCILFNHPGSKIPLNLQDLRRSLTRTSCQDSCQDFSKILQELTRLTNS